MRLNRGRAALRRLAAVRPWATRAGRASAGRSLAAVILNGRPPFRPRARAEARPATVRSAINSRSNSASAAKIPNTSLPAAVVVSTAAP
ncbi:hypothetical protein G6F61_013681 [Rhizopus arrhizus]|nr:hypothetical protein G6F61_013681 [Rhizopus arrhizus]